MRLFADDAIVYRQVGSADDHQILQHDLDSLSGWSHTWQMNFNVSKCHPLSITNKRNSSLHEYDIDSQSLSSVDSHDCLGVRCTRDLRWGSHCRKIASSASSTLGIIRRTLKPCTAEVKERAYMALVRPKLEYAAAVWNPNTTTDVSVKKWCKVYSTSGQR